MSANMQTPVKDAIITTEKKFEDLANTLDQPTYEHKKQVWENEGKRFHEWALKIGAWEPGDGAVDSRISRHCDGRYSSSSMDQLIIRSLQDLQAEVRKAQELVTGALPGGRDPSDNSEESIHKIMHRLDTLSDVLLKQLNIQELSKSGVFRYTVY